MNMRKCDVCNLETAYALCPQCGSRTKKPHPILTTLLLTILTTIGIYTWLNSSSPKGKINDEQAQTAQPATQPRYIEQPIVKAKDLSQYFQDVQNIKNRINEYQEYIRTNYPDEAMLRQTTIDLLVLKGILLSVKPDTTKHRRLLAITKSYKNDVSILLRDMYAQGLNAISIKENIPNVKIYAYGENKEVLHYEWIFMTAKYAAGLANNGGIFEKAKLLEFDSIVFSDGYNQKWKYNLIVDSK